MKTALILTILMFGVGFAGLAQAETAQEPVWQKVCKGTFSDPKAFETLLSRPIVLLGEMHGTQESPDFALGLTCDAIQSGKHVVFSVELPRALGKDLHDPRTKSLWENGIQEGRTSKAMYHLLDSLHQLQQSGQVTLLYDDVSRQDMNAWGQKSADKLLAAANSPDTEIISLAGNMHNSRRAYLDYKGNWVKATGVWTGKKAWVVNFIGLGKGSMYNCSGTSMADMVCGPHPASGVGKGFAKGLVGPGTGAEGSDRVENNPNYDYYFVFDHFTASPPAFPKAKSETDQ